MNEMSAAAQEVRIEPLAVLPAIAVELARLHSICFRDSPQTPWSESAFATLLAAPGVQGLVALNGGGDLLGFIMGRTIVDESEVLTVCVDPVLRRRGLATQLMVKLHDSMAGSKRIVLEVAVTNAAARALYARLGYSEIARRAGYYRSAGAPVDALVLALAKNAG